METITARRELNGMTKVDMEEYFDDVEVESLYSWIDRIPLSRPKKNIAKDFADAGEYEKTSAKSILTLDNLYNVCSVQKEGSFPH